LSSITGDAEFDAWLYSRAREIIRQKGDMITTRQAVREVLKDPATNEQILKFTATRDGALGKEFVAKWRASPDKTIKWLDAELAELSNPD
jgi:hypothetical protein